MSRRLSSSAHVELARLVAVGAAMLIVTFLVVGRSRAAFVGTTTQPGNHLDSGSVTLTDSDAPSATQMFNVSGMVANQVEARCIQVTYTGTVNPTEVELFAALTSSPPNDGLEAYLDMSVDVGDWGGAASSFPACTNFANGTNIYNGATNTLDDFLTSYPDSANATRRASIRRTPTTSQCSGSR
ncbi:MAG: hypothetical protein R2715_15390 [Ilumatobacteraceae bacterium]